MHSSLNSSGVGIILLIVSSTSTLSAALQALMLISVTQPLWYSITAYMYPAASAARRLCAH
jgi:zinc transporter ZupT